MEKLFDSDVKLTRHYQQTVRAKFLEKEISLLFSNAFPECEMCESYKWSGFETDFLARVDSVLFVVEAKSHKAHGAALRGGRDAAKRHFDSVILHPSEQSFRFEQRIKQAIADPQHVAQILPNFPLSFAKIKTVMRLSIVLDDIATVQSSLHLAKDCGWIPPGHPIAPCMHVSDLAIVFEMLEPAALKIHYLKRRMECQEHVRLTGDELDHLGLYMKTGLLFSQENEIRHDFLEVGMSDLIDAYYYAKDAKLSKPKPRVRLHPHWIDLCKTLEKRSFDGWVTVAMVILKFSYEDQLKIVSRFQAIKLNVKNRWKDPSHDCCVMLLPAKESQLQDAVIFHAYNNQNMEKRYEVMEDLASHALEPEHVQTVAVFSLNIDNQIGPYTSLRLFCRPNTNGAARPLENGEVVQI